jgi:hypothetical protein
MYNRECKEVQHNRRCKMNDTEKVLMNRDGLTATEAKREFNRERSEVLDAIENGSTYDDIEEMLLEDMGLEMDYIMDMF